MARVERQGRRSSKLRALALFYLIVSPLLIVALLMLRARYSTDDRIELETSSQAKLARDWRPAPLPKLRKPDPSRVARSLQKKSKPLRIISGQVVDHEGFPLPKATARLKSRDAETAGEIIIVTSETDEEGRFTFINIDPGMTVRIDIQAHHHHERQTEEFQIPETNLELPVIVLEPLGMIEGMVLDLFGHPVPKAAAVLKAWDAQTSSKQIIAKTTTDEGGYYHFLDVEPQMLIWIEIAKPDYLKFESSMLRSPQTELVMPFIILNPLGVLQGIVLDPEGFPVAGVSVHVYDESHEFRHTKMPRTDEHGLFSITGLPTGTYGVRLRYGSRNLRALRGIYVEQGTVRDDLEITVKLPRGERRYDTQTLAVYRAERKVRGGRQRFKSLEEIVKWVDGIVASDWFRASFPKISSIEVKTGAGRAVAYASRYSWRRTKDIHGYISLPQWARQKLVILHEIGHVCCDRGGHGPGYTGILLALVERFIDRETMVELGSAFEETGARVKEFRSAGR